MRTNKMRAFSCDGKANYLAMLFRQVLVGSDDDVKVGVHELGRDVDIVELFRDRRRDNVSYADNLFSNARKSLKQVFDRIFA